MRLSHHVCVLVFATGSLLPAMAQQPPAASDCSMSIQANDAMQFDVKTVSVPATCERFAVTLRHIGRLPKNVMGHNWVLTTTADYKEVASQSTKAGPAKDYIDASDARIIAHTSMIGGGETSAVEVDVAKLRQGVEYTYFCTYPAHSAIMRGTLVLQK